MAEDQRFGQLLRLWRDRRGVTQMDLSDKTGISTRHLSFLETGRSSPSREAVNIIAEAMEIPDWERARLFLAAGFAVDWNQVIAESQPTEAPVRDFQEMVKAYEPLPAIVKGPTWNIVAMSAGVGELMNRVRAHGAAHHLDMTQLENILFNPNGIRGLITNWEEIAETAARGFFRNFPNPDSGGPMGELINRLRDMPEINNEWLDPLVTKPVPFRGTMKFEDGPFSFSLEVFYTGFSGAYSGYALAFTYAADPENDRIARQYFSGAEKPE
ncbi:MAG: helix-turn-helix domain-containing protein [Deltaproteobacteria bacterium]|nr:helix-turn-helix domain-containing protein [Deltaproteobacteria bacterium]